MEEESIGTASQIEEDFQPRGKKRKHFNDDPVSYQYGDFNTEETYTHEYPDCQASGDQQRLQGISLEEEAMDHVNPQVDDIIGTITDDQANTNPQNDEIEVDDHNNTEMYENLDDNSTFELTFGSDVGSNHDPDLENEFGVNNNCHLVDDIAMGNVYEANDEGGACDNESTDASPWDMDYETVYPGYYNVITEEESNTNAEYDIHYRSYDEALICDAESDEEYTDVSDSVVDDDEEEAKVDSQNKNASAEMPVKPVSLIDGLEAELKMVRGMVIDHRQKEENEKNSKKTTEGLKDVKHIKTEGKKKNCRKRTKRNQNEEANISRTNRDKMNAVMDSRKDDKNGIKTKKADKINKKRNTNPKTSKKPPDIDKMTIDQADEETDDELLVFDGYFIFIFLIVGGAISYYLGRQVAMYLFPK